MAKYKIVHYINQSLPESAVKKKPTIPLSFGKGS